MQAPQLHIYHILYVKYLHSCQGFLSNVTISVTGWQLLLAGRPSLNMQLEGICLETTMKGM